MKLIDLHKHDIVQLILQAPMKLPSSVLSKILMEEGYLGSELAKDEVGGVFVSYSRRKKQQYMSVFFEPSGAKGKEGRIKISFSPSRPPGVRVAPMSTLIKPFDKILRHNEAKIGKFDIDIRLEFEEESRQTWATHTLNAFSQPFNKTVAEMGAKGPQITGMRFSGVENDSFFRDLIIEKLQEGKIHVFLGATQVFEVDQREGGVRVIEDAVKAVMILIKFIHHTKGMPRNG